MRRPTTTPTHRVTSPAVPLTLQTITTVTAMQTKTTMTARTSGPHALRSKLSNPLIAPLFPANSPPSAISLLLCCNLEPLRPSVPERGTEADPASERDTRDARNPVLPVGLVEVVGVLVLVPPS